MLVVRISSRDSEFRLHLSLSVFLQLQKLHLFAIAMFIYFYTGIDRIESFSLQNQSRKRGQLFSPIFENPLVTSPLTLTLKI